MARYEATFDIDSKSDAYAVRRLAERMHDTLREELQHSPTDTTAPNEILEQFKVIRSATRDQSTGSLTVIYNEGADSFED